MSDYEEDVMSDDENEIQDLEQLNAVLIDDEPCSTTISRPSTGTNLCNFSTNYEEFSKIETVLALNKMCDEKLRRLEKVLQSRLVECRNRLSEVQSSEKDERYDRIEVFRYVTCGKPYFKDKANFPAPDNKDSILMAKAEMYDFSNIVSIPGWTVNDKSQFTALIQKMSQEIRERNIDSQITALKRENKLHDKKNDSKIAALKREYDKVRKMQFKDLALPINEEYDWDYVANKLNYRHNPQEYRSLWKLFLHPSINKNTWTRNEHMKLQKIACDENLQNWDKIAKELKTGRTSYQCFVYFRTNMSNTFTGRKWTKEEEEYLKRLIEYYKEDNYIPWSKVAASMENRTKIQIYNKYSRLNVLRKGRFLAEEDAVILTCAETFGPNFKKMAKYLPGRSLTQCRVRYQVLAKKRISTVWTIDEDRKLIQLMANQDCTTNYSSIAPYFPGKDRVHLRARYITLAKWMRRNPNVDVAKAPRRGARRLGHGRSTDDLNRAIEKLKSKIQTEIVDKKSKKVTRDSSEDAIEDAIIATLVTENVKIEESRKIKINDGDSGLSEDNVAAQTQKCNMVNLRKILTILRAKLNKEKFSKSPLGKIYKELIDPEDTVHTLKVKSYSKQNSETFIEINKSPDIWGKTCLGSLAHVFPPHYSTITGCRKLMSYVSAKQHNETIDSLNLNVAMRKNMMLKNQAFLLMERFNTLFLWPMLLSNTPPETSITMNEDESQLLLSPEKNYPIFRNEDYVTVMPFNHLKSSNNIVSLDFETN